MRCGIFGETGRESRIGVVGRVRQDRDVFV